jgi:coenzyme Q-binding protein COQ10
MHRHRVVRHLPYTPEQLFELVGGVDRYPEFVPWITTMRVRNAREAGEGITLVDAEAGVGFSFLKERFATRVRRDRGRLEIRVDLLHGPFKRLENVWSFEAQPTGCKVVFEIDFEFKSRLLEALLAANFNRAVEKLIGCFEARAAHLYPPVEAAGRPADASSRPNAAAPGRGV